MRDSTPHAFTFVELLIVIAVVSVLTALLLPTLAAVKLAGLGAASSSNLKQLAAANGAYASEHDGYYCPAQDRNNLVRWHGARAAINGKFDPRQGYLSPYLGAEGRVKICPLFQEIVNGSLSFEDGSGGYGYNECYIGGTPASLFQAIKASQVPQPARTVMFTTSAYATAAGAQEYPFAEPPFWPDEAGEPSDARPSPSVHFRFRGQAIVAWCDGHVSAEAMIARANGYNPHDGDAGAERLGWFGPDVANGYWKP